MLAITMTAAVLVACGGGAATTRFFIVDPVESMPLQGATGTAVEILDLRVPQYLERPRIASRTGANELAYSQSSQWGDNLRKNLARTMARNLSAMLDTVDVSTPYARSSTTPAYRVLVHIDEFEQAANGHARIVARWQVVDALGRTRATESVRLESTMPLAAQDHAAVVGELQRLFGELSRRVAESIIAQEPAG
jgi:uncharacterized lipoprotein YmbA